nr:hypothetical protein [Tanacetum cinerariifolium]
MLNKENYVPWSSRLLWYAKSRPNGKLIHNSILNGPYVRKMIPEPGDANREITVTKTFHLQTDDELSDKELKQIESDDQAIQTILLGLPEDIYAAVDSCKTTQEIWFTSNEGESIESYYHFFLKLMNDLKRNKHFPEKIASNLKFLNNLQPEWSQHKKVDELKAKRIAKTQDPLALMANSNNPYAFPAPHQDQSSFNHNYLQQPMPNPKDITDPTTAMNMALALMAKAFKLNYSTPTNNNQRISSNPKNRQIAQPGMNIGQDRQMQMVVGNGNQDQIRNGNLVVARNEGNAAGQNGNQIRCYNCRGVEEYDLMAAAADLDEIVEVNVNCILMANLQQASISGTQTDSAPVYDTDGSAERISSNPRNMQIAQPGMNMGQDRQMQMIGSNGGNQFRQYAWQNAGNLNGYNEVQNVENQVASNPRIQNVGNQNGLIVVQGNGIQNQFGNGNIVAVRPKGNAARQNGNQIRCYNCMGIGHYARNCTARPRRRDAAYLQTQLLIAQKEKAGIQLQAEEYDLMAATADLNEIEEVNANCILMANLQQASSLGTQTDSTPVYDSDGSAET